MKENIPNNISIKYLPHFPTVLVGTGKGDDSNLITVAMVHVFSIDPPMIGIGIAPERHSYSLLREMPEFTINVPSKEQLDYVLNCGKVSGKDIDKFSKFRLTREESKEISVPGVKEFPFIIECRLKKELETGDHHWFVGEVVNSKKSEDYDRGDSILYWGGEFRKPGDVLKST